MFGFTLSLISRNMVPVVVAFALYEAGRGAGAVSSVLAAETAPLVVFMLVGGVVADKFPRRDVMAYANFLRFFSQALLAVLFFTHHTPLWAIMSLMACIGVGGAFFAPGLQGLIPELVPDQHLQSANGISSMAQAIGSVSGPALGGLLVATTGGAIAIAIDSASYLVCAAILFTLPKQADRTDNQENVIILLKEGWTEFFGRKWIWVSVLQFTLLHLVVIGPLFVLGSLRFAHVAHGALGWGGLLSLMGAGTIIGSLVAMRCKPRFPLRVATFTLFTFALLPASLAANLSYPITGACFLVCGLCMPLYGVLWTTLMQTKVPKDKLSRVTSYDYVGSICLLPVGYALAAPMASWLTLSGALWFGAGAVVVTTILVLMVKEVWTIESEPEASLPT